MNGKKIRTHAIIWIGVFVALVVLMKTTSFISTVPGPDGKSNIVEDVTYWVIQQGTFDYEKEHCRRISNINREDEAVTKYKTAFQITYPEFLLDKYFQQRPDDVAYMLSETTYLFYSTENIPSAAFLERLSRGGKQASL